MPRPDPFSISVYAGDPRCAPSATIAFHEAARVELAQRIQGLQDDLGSRRGRLVMLRSTRAGFGKTHLLARAFTDNQGAALMLPVRLERESPPSWTNLYDAIIAPLAERPPDRSPAPLTTTARQTFAELVSDLITRGTVPAEHPARAIRGLQLSYRTMFDLRGEGSPIAAWFTANRAALLPPMAQALVRRGTGDLPSCERLLERLLRHELEGAGALAGAADRGGARDARADLYALVRRVSRERPLVLVFDDLDGLYRDGGAALELAWLLSELARDGAVPLSIIALNDDLWEASFAGDTPSALADRLTESEIRLHGIDIDAARALLSARIDAAEITGNDGAPRGCPIDLDTIYRNHPGGLSPRELLRQASAAWRSGAAQTPAQPTVSPPAEPVTGEPSGTPATETLGRIRAMLKEVNQQRAKHTATPPAAPDIPLAPWPAVANSAPGALHDFARERAALFLGADLLFDPEAIRHTLELAGRHSPLIDYHEFDVADGTAAARWRSPGQEILFGFEPAERIPYWRALVEQAGESALGQAKVVAFTPPGTHGFTSDGLNGHARERLDVLELDRGALASLAAAETVMSKAASEDETFTQISPELDFLWRRITRPMGT